MTMYELFTGKRDRTHIHLQYGLGYRVVHDITLKLVGLSRHVYHDQFLTGVASPGRCWKILTPVVHQILTERRSIFNYDQRNSSWNDSFMCRRLKKRIKKDCLSITAWNYNNVVLVLHSDSSSDHVRCMRKKKQIRQLIPLPKELPTTIIYKWILKTHVFKWKRSMYVVVPARNIGNIWYFSSLTVPAPTNTSFFKRTLRRKRFTQLDERECV